MCCLPVYLSQQTPTSPKCRHSDTQNPTFCQDPSGRVRYSKYCAHKMTKSQVILKTAKSNKENGTNIGWLNKLMQRCFLPFPIFFEARWFCFSVFRLSGNLDSVVRLSRFTHSLCLQSTHVNPSVNCTDPFTVSHYKHPFSAWLNCFLWFQDTFVVFQDTFLLCWWGLRQWLIMASTSSTFPGSLKNQKISLGFQ